MSDSTLPPADLTHEQDFGDAAASTELTHVCYSCGGSITADANPCPHCGTDLTEEVAGAHHSTHARDYVRRHRVNADDLDRFPNR